MLTIGCHLSSSKGYMNMARETLEIGGSTFQFFTRNPRGGQAKDLDMKDIEEFLKFAPENGINIILAHAPYTLNPCAATPELREYTLNTMKDDIRRLEFTPGNMYNFHPGSHVGQGIETGINYISELLNNLLYENMTTTVLLETMAGKGSEVGSRFEELRDIINKTEDNTHLGVCLDTCHVNDAGYDIVNHLDDVLEEFDKVIGINRLKAIHINDSKNPFASHKDRHEKIGEGYIGIDAFERIINHPQLRELPFYLETPWEELSGYAGEISLLKSKR